MGLGHNISELSSNKPLFILSPTSLTQKNSCLASLKGQTLEGVFQIAML